MPPPTEIILPSIIRAIGQPQADDIRADGLCDLDALQHMLDRSLSYPIVKMAQTPETVDIVLKEVRIHGPDMHAKFTCICLHGIPIIFLVPGYVNCDTRAYTSHMMYLGRICKLLAQVARCPRPMEDLESRSRIAIPP